MKRWEVLTEFIKNNNFKIGAEIGIFRGKTTKRTLRACDEIYKYYCVDPWKTYKGAVGDNHIRKSGNKIYKNFLKSIKKFGDRVVVKKMFSEDAAKEIQDGCLDFVFIDGNHEEEYVKLDIISWYPKIRKGGILGGHDYDEVNFKSVVNAVNSNFNKEEIILKDDNTWWVWKT